MNDEVWVLGASGRTGREVAKRLAAAGVPLGLAGRNAARLETLAAELTGRRSAQGAEGAENTESLESAEGASPVRVIVGQLDAVLGRVRAEAPRVVVSTVGPFTTMSPRVVAALPPGTHFVDVANEYTATEALLAAGPQAARSGRTLVGGAGFGVLAVEAAALRAVEGHAGPPEEVRVDALASVALEAGVLGAALAGSVVEALAFGGREVRDGRLVRARTAGRPESFVTPDGDAVRTVSGASGELLAAWNATSGRSVVGASALVPTGPVARAVIPVLSGLFRLPGVSGLAATRLASVKLRATARPREHSWARARVRWADGSAREVWLRADDAMDFTSSTTAEVARRLWNGDGTPGAHTPGALFGAGLAEAAGGTFV